jgi:hypothetical protein
MATNTARPVAGSARVSRSHRQHVVSSLQAIRARAKDARDFVCNGDLCVAVAVAVVAELLTILPNAESIASSLLCAVVTRFGPGAVGDCAHLSAIILPCAAEEFICLEARAICARSRRRNRDFCAAEGRRIFGVPAVNRMQQ